MNLDDVAAMGFAPVVRMQPLAEQEDPRGPSYGRRPRPVGEPFRAVAVKMSSEQLFRRGKEQSTVAYKVWCDWPAPVDEKGLMESPETGRLDVTSRLDFPGEGASVLEGERTA